MTKFSLFIALLFLVGCSNTKPKVYSVENLVGTWLLEDYGYGDYSHSLIAFLPTGEKCVISYDFNSDGSVEFDYYFNAYSIENKSLITRVIKSRTALLPAGYEIKDEIKYLTQSKLNLLMLKPVLANPRIEKHIRLENETPDRICAIVRKHLQI